MSYYTKKNNGVSLLDGNISSSDTSLSITAGQGSKFPTTGTFMCVIWGASYESPDHDPNHEYIEVSAVSGDTFTTIVRGRESTSGHEWSDGDNIANVVTVGMLEQYESDSLEAIHDVTPASDKLPYFTGANTANTTDFTAFGRSLVDDANSTVARSTLELGSIATQNANNVAITGGSITGITDLAVADGGTGASTLPANTLLLGNGTSAISGSAITQTPTGERILIGATDDGVNKLQVEGGIKGQLGTFQNGDISLKVGADANALTLTDSNTKQARIVVPHYLNAEEPVCIAYMGADNTDNTLSIGGGTSQGNAATYILFYTAANYNTTTGTERARITSGGNFLVGTTTDDGANKLQVEGGTNISSILTVGEASTATGKQLKISYDGTNDKGIIQSVHWGTAYTALELNPAGGRVLVGTATDDGTYLLQVEGSARCTLLKAYTEELTSDTQTSIQLYSTGASADRFSPCIEFNIHGGAGRAKLFTKRLGGYGGRLYIQTDDTSGVSQTRILVNESGNVLIGTTTDDGVNKLQVEGDARIKNILIKNYDSVTDTIAQNTSDGTDNKRLTLAGGGTIGTTRGAYCVLAGNEHASTGSILLLAGNVSGGHIKLFTGNSQARLVATDTGNILIGTETDDSTHKLQVAGSIGITQAATNTCKIGHATDANVYLAWVYNSGTPASSYGTVSTYAGSNPLVLQQSGGNLLIGTTTDDGTNKVQISGNLRVGGAYEYGIFGVSSNDTYIQSNGSSARNIIFYVGASEVARISSSSTFLVGTTSPTVFSVTPKYVLAATDGATPFVLCNTSNAGRMAINGNSDGSYTIYDGGNGSSWIAGISQYQGSVNVACGIRSQAGITFTTGAGIEMQYASGEGYIDCYDRDGATYKPLHLDGSKIITGVTGNFLVGGTTDDAVHKAQITGSTYISGVLRCGPSTSAASGASAGDLIANRDGTKGALFFGDAVAFIYYNGSEYQFGGGGSVYMHSAGRMRINNATDDGVNTLQVNGTTISSQYKLSALNTAPSSASDTGTLGEIRIAADYIYVCTATNTWVRAAIATW